MLASAVAIVDTDDTNSVIPVGGYPLIVSPSSPVVGLGGTDLLATATPATIIGLGKSCRLASSAIAASFGPDFAGSAPIGLGLAAFAATIGLLRSVSSALGTTFLPAASTVGFLGMGGLVLLPSPSAAPLCR